MNPSIFLNSLFEVAVAKAQPKQCIPQFLTETRVTGRRVVFGAGKASAAMAQVVEQHLTGALEGLIVTRYGHAVPCQQIEIVEAGHPVPDNNGMEAASRMLETAAGLTPSDLVLCLISGGGSSLLSLPASGLSLKDKQEITSVLLKCGATIHEINCVRKHLSAIKGGRLAAACAPGYPYRCTAVHRPATSEGVRQGDVRPDFLRPLALSTRLPYSEFADRWMIEDLDGISVGVEEVQRPSAVAVAPRPVFNLNTVFVKVGGPTVHIARFSHEQTQMV